MNENTVTALWNQSVAEVGDCTHQKIISRFAELVAAVERGACAAVCARLRRATGQRIGESDPETEAWNKALRDAERFIAERSNVEVTGLPRALCGRSSDRRERGRP